MYAIIKRNKDSTSSGSYHKRDVLGKRWTGWVDSFDQVVKAECTIRCIREYTDTGDYVQDKVQNGQHIVCMVDNDTQYSVTEFRDLYPEHFI